VTWSVEQMRKPPWGVAFLLAASQSLATGC